MTPILTRCIESICSERDSGWNETFDVVDQLVKDYGEERLANRVVEEVPRTVPFEVVADLLSILIWSTSDNGCSITNSANLWLRDQTDTRKVLIALNLEVIPFSSEDEAKQVLMPLMKSNHLAYAHCSRILRFFENSEVEHRQTTAKVRDGSGAACRASDDLSSSTTCYADSTG